MVLLNVQHLYLFGTARKGVADIHVHGGRVHQVSISRFHRGAAANVPVLFNAGGHSETRRLDFDDVGLDAAVKTLEGSFDDDGAMVANGFGDDARHKVVVRIEGLSGQGHVSKESVHDILLHGRGYLHIGWRLY